MAEVRTTPPKINTMTRLINHELFHQGGVTDMVNTFTGKLQLPSLALQDTNISYSPAGSECNVNVWSYVSI